MYRSAVLWLAALVAQGCIVVTIQESSEDLTFTSDVAHVDVSTGSGDVDVVVDPTLSVATVQRRLRYTGDPPQLIAEVQGGVLLLDTVCRRGQQVCQASYTVRLPQAASMSADTGSGEISGEGLAGDLMASTGSGDVTLIDVSGSAEIDTGSGDVDVVRSDLSLLWADTGSGDVSLDTTSSPREVVIDTGSGDVDLWLPAGAYDVSIDTGSGDVSLGPGIEQSSGSDSVIRIDTGSGDVTILAR